MATTLGRFNYLTVRQGDYKLIFSPADDDLAFIPIIATGLTREEVTEATKRINKIIDALRFGELVDKPGYEMGEDDDEDDDTVPSYGRRE